MVKDKVLNYSQQKKRGRICKTNDGKQRSLGGIRERERRAKKDKGARNGLTRQLRGETDCDRRYLQYTAFGWQKGARISLFWDKRGNLTVCDRYGPFFYLIFSAVILILVFSVLNLQIL
jgi:hypothetical protein